MKVMKEGNSPSVEYGHRQYDRFVRPIEAAHGGEFAAVTGDGRVILGKTILEAMDHADRELGTEVLIFKVGDFAVGKWLSLLSM